MNNSTLRREASPDKGYRSDQLWLPLKHINNLAGVKQSLTFQMDAQPDIHAWSLTESHICVPREYIPYEKYSEMPFEIENVTPHTFPEIVVKPTFTLRDEIQEIGKSHLVNRGSGILSLSCGKGKTVISLHAWTEIGTPALIVVPTQDLAHQWISRIVEHTDIRREEVGWIQGNKWDWDKPIAVALIQTLASRSDEIPEEMRNHFGVVIYDEVHRLGAPYFNRTASLGQGIRWGLSATPFRKDGLDALYRYHTGDILYQNLEQEVIPEVFFKKTGVALTAEDADKLKDRSGEINMPRLYTWLGEHEDRNKKIISMLEMAKSDGRVVLALSERVEHLKYLHSKFDDAGIIYGAVKGEDRPNILQDNDMVFAITQLARDGLDRKELDTVVITMPFTDRGRFEQIIGRSQRAKETKPVVIIFEDERIPGCKAMCQKLRAHLTDLKYPYYISD
tara:strand:- start:31797 stop:33143 length:1347 start_codon:yes stop_codon:yes gene_type:complete